MADWTGGYIADFSYTHGYFAELNPQRLKLAFLANGLAFPEVGVACELGFGQGMSTNVHAGASVTRWYGTDFNPAQAGFARELSAAAGSNAQLFDESFEQFCQRDDLPEFDFIGLHGIWSWISDENRRIIVDFIGRKLKVGGVVYISYNCLPGCAPIAPLREILAEHGKVMSPSGADIPAKIDAAIGFTKRLVEAGARYPRATPAVTERLGTLERHNKHYLAHEYLNQHWVPMSFSEIARWLAPAKLSFAASANYLDLVHDLNVTPEQRALLAEIPDVTFRETVRDFILNQQFRRDYWVRGPRRLHPPEVKAALERMRFVLTVPAERVTMKVAGPLGEGDLQPEVYTPLLALLSSHRPCSLAQMRDVLADRPNAQAAALQALYVLFSKGVLEAAQDEQRIKAAVPVAARLNRAICERARCSNEVQVLASPVTGGGLQVGQIEQLYLLARVMHRGQPEAMARFIIDSLHQANQRLLRDGQVIEKPEDEMSYVLDLVRTIETTLLPTLEALKIVF